MMFGLQQTGQSSTYCCSAPAEGSSGMTMSSPHDGQVYRPSSRARFEVDFLFRRLLIKASSFADTIRATREKVQSHWCASVVDAWSHRRSSHSSSDRPIFSAIVSTKSEMATASRQL